MSMLSSSRPDRIPLRLVRQVASIESQPCIEAYRRCRQSPERIANPPEMKKILINF